MHSLGLVWFPLAATPPLGWAGLVRSPPGRRTAAGRVAALSLGRAAALPSGLLHLTLTLTSPSLNEHEGCAADSALCI